MTNFNITPDRRKIIHINKWTYYPKDVLPMWVADMDFPAPKPILDTLRKHVDHGVLGYETPGIVLQEPLPHAWTIFTSWKVKPEWVLAVPGINASFNIAARAFCSPKKGWRSRPRCI
jgi:cysteine-S-conjugate beta-lyase